MKERPVWLSLVPNIVSGFLVLAPIFLAILLLGHGIQFVAGLVHPVATLLPVWLPAAELLALLLILALCFVVGLAVRTGPGRWLRDRIERTVLCRIPGYTLFRDLTAQLAGDKSKTAWKPVLARFDDGLVPAFLIEESEGGHCTVFVPAVPTPFTGAVYVMDTHRVFPVDLSLPRALQSISRWGDGTSEWLRHVEPGKLAVATALASSDADQKN